MNKQRRKQQTIWITNIYFNVTWLSSDALFKISTDSKSTCLYTFHCSSFILNSNNVQIDVNPKLCSLEASKFVFCIPRMSKSHSIPRMITSHPIYPTVYLHITSGMCHVSLHFALLTIEQRSFACCVS